MFPVWEVRGGSDTVIVKTVSLESRLKVELFPSIRSPQLSAESPPGGPNTPFLFWSSHSVIVAPAVGVFMGSSKCTTRVSPGPMTPNWLACWSLAIPMLSGAPVFGGGPDEVVVDELLAFDELLALDELLAFDPVEVDAVEDDDEPPGRHSGGPRKGAHIPVLEELVDVDELDEPFEEVDGADDVLEETEPDDDPVEELPEPVEELPEPVEPPELDPLEEEPDEVDELVVQLGHCGGEGTPAMPTKLGGKRPAALPE